MGKYIDAEKLIAEIEGRKNNNLMSAKKCPTCYFSLVANEDIEILEIITSLQQEQSEVDFEKELKNEKAKLLDAFGPMNGEQCLAIRNFARHFYELDRTGK